MLFEGLHGDCKVGTSFLALPYCLVLFSKPPGGGDQTLQIANPLLLLLTRGTKRQPKAKIAHGQGGNSRLYDSTVITHLEM